MRTPLNQQLHFSLSSIILAALSGNRSSLQQFQVHVRWNCAEIVAIRGAAILNNLVSDYSFRSQYSRWRLHGRPDDFNAKYRGTVHSPGSPIKWTRLRSIRHKPGYDIWSTFQIILKLWATILETNEIISSPSSASIPSPPPYQSCFAPKKTSDNLTALWNNTVQDKRGRK